MVAIDRYCSRSWGAGYFFIYLNGHTILDFAKNVLPLLEPKLLTMCERIGEALKIVYIVLANL